MTTLFCFSDTHGTPISEQLKLIMAESDKTVFCGDGPLSDREFFSALGEKFVEVRGNTDGHVRGVSEETVFEADGVKVLVTHGHEYRVKSDLLEIYYRARELGCTLVLYGHTHLHDVTCSGGVTLVCVGSLGRSLSGENGYTYVVLNNGKIFAKFVKIF